MPNINIFLPTKDKPQDNLSFGKEFSSGFSPALFPIFPKLLAFLVKAPYLT